MPPDTEIRPIPEASYATLGADSVAAVAAMLATSSPERVLASTDLIELHDEGSTFGEVPPSDELERTRAAVMESQLLLKAAERQVAVLESEIQRQHEAGAAAHQTIATLEQRVDQKQALVTLAHRRAGAFEAEMERQQKRLFLANERMVGLEMELELLKQKTHEQSPNSAGDKAAVLGALKQATAAQNRAAALEVEVARLKAENKEATQQPRAQVPSDTDTVEDLEAQLRIKHEHLLAVQDRLGALEVSIAQREREGLSAKREIFALEAELVQERGKACQLKTFRYRETERHRSTLAFMGGHIKGKLARLEAAVTFVTCLSLGLAAVLMLLPIFSCKVLLLVAAAVGAFGRGNVLKRVACVVRGNLRTVLRAYRRHTNRHCFPVRNGKLRALLAMALVVALKLVLWLTQPVLLCCVVVSLLGLSVIGACASIATELDERHKSALREIHTDDIAVGFQGWAHMGTPAAETRDENAAGSTSVRRRMPHAHFAHKAQ